MKAPVVILAIGNRSRGDDALAPLLLDRLEGWLAKEGLGEGFDLVEEFQLQVENVLDLEGRRLALFLDASRDAPRRVALGERFACAGLANSHELEPEAVLEVYERIQGRAPPPAYVLKLRGTGFELGAGLTEEARAAAEEGWRLLCRLARQPDRQDWQDAARALDCAPP
jgi:hydrogenase maturation protease